MTDLKALAEEVRNTNLANHDHALRELREALVAVIEHLDGTNAPAEPKATPKARSHR